MRRAACKIYSALALMVLAGCSEAPPPPPPIEPPRVVMTKRQLPSEFIYRGTNVTIRAGAPEVVIQKDRGVETLEMLLDYEIAGDFVGYITAEFATAEELGVDFRGGTPVPYYGFRSADGRKECYFHLGTFHPKGKRYEIVIRREAGKVSATRDGAAAQGVREDLAEPGFVCFLMNDVSRVRLHRVRLESPPGQVVVDYRGTATNTSPISPGRH